MYKSHMSQKNKQFYPKLIVFIIILIFGIILIQFDTPENFGHTGHGFLTLIVGLIIFLGAMILIVILLRYAKRQIQNREQIIVGFITLFIVGMVLVIYGTITLFTLATFGIIIIVFTVIAGIYFYLQLHAAERQKEKDPEKVRKKNRLILIVVFIILIFIILNIILPPLFYPI